MNKFTTGLLAITLFLSQNETYGKEYYNSNAQQLVQGAEVVVTNDETSQIKFIRLANGSEPSISSGVEWLKNVLEAPAEVDFVLYEKNTDKIGYTHFRYYQTYKGVRVENAVYYLHTQANMIKSANGDYFDEISLPSVEANITSAQAKANAKSIIKNQGIWYDDITDKTKLVIVKHKNSYKLAYKVDIYAENPLSRYFVFIDANSGRELYRIDRIHHSDSRGTAVTRYNGTKTITTDSVSSNLFRLQETGRGNGIRTYDLNTSTSYFNAVDFTDNDNYWNTTTNYDDAAYDVHYGSEVTYDFFFNNYSRNSYNDSGAVINSYVHYGSNYANAFWDGSRMTYGDGDGVNTTPLTSIDVVAHEITHAVTQRTANLIYSYESGALNESFSDILGIAVDFYANPLSANYLMGEQFNVSGTPIRSMINPNAHGHPDTYLGTHWYTGSLDNGGVHTNSGVQNYWFYLLANGGNGINDILDTFYVSPIGISKATDISYRNLTVYLTPTSQYSDARFYAIQSATDLYGTCSNEVISTTNAWHAVGVGSSYLNGVVASFYSSNTYSCESPATVSFTNTSINGSTYRWDFGDGDTSNLQNPTHTYTLPGIYTVSLIVNGSSACNSSDTLQLTNYINVTTVGRPSAASCSPTTTNAGTYGVGIFHFSLDSINKSSLGGIEGYQDYSCSDFTTLTEGNSYNINVTTGTSYGENVKVWIDLNNDSSFNMTNELVFVSNSQLSAHSGTLVIPNTTVHNTPLRLRVMSDFQGVTHNSSCSDPTYGQVEDYSVSIIPNTNPPSANFQANKTTAGQSETVQFTDLSQNVPTSWSWSFPGGTPNSSTLQNPSVSYSSSGTYDVTLIVSNAYGSDTITRSNYMSIVSVYTMCLDNSSNAASGTLFDSGGPTGNYSNYENCSFLINPPCANSVTLSFNSFSLESCCDYFRVYDGTNTSGTLLLSANGTSLPSSVTANSGSMYITFSSDYSVTRAGWEATWTAQLANIKPVADFSMSSSNPPFATNVSFLDQTTVFPTSWLWNFGDGDTSHVQNPVHKYTSRGSYTTTLISTNCANSDTISKTLTVQSPPQISIDSNYLRATVPCGDSIDLQFKVKNLAGGDLVYESKGNNQGSASNSGKLEVLALTLGTDLSREYPNTINAINQYYNNYNLTALNTTDSTVLRSALANKDLLLIPEIESNVISSYLNFTQVLQDFVSDGGELIFCGTGSSNNIIIFNTGLFSGNYLTAINPGNPLVNASPNHYLMDSITTTVTSQSATLLYDITNPNTESVLTSSSNDDVVVSRTYGNGRVTLIGFDYYNYSNETARIIANAVKNASRTRSQQWLIANNVKDTLSAGDSSIITVSINAGGVFAGIYRDTLEVVSNDSLNNVIFIPVELTVEGQANIQTDKDSIVFSQLQVGASTADSLTIMNQGCDTLSVDSLVFSDADFSTNINTIVIPPYEEKTISINFAPSVIQTYTDSLSIFSQDTTKVVAISGTGVGAPSLTYNPSSIIDTISVCGDSITIPLTVYNNGQGDLSAKFKYSVIGNNSGNKNALLIKDANSWGVNVNSTILMGLGANVTTITSNQIATTNFNNYDLIVMESRQGSSYYNNYLTQISKFNSYLNNGGRIHFCNSSSAGLQLPGGSLTTSNFSQYDNINYVINPSHPLHDSCSGPYTGSNASHYYFTNLPASAQVLIENTNNLPTAVEVAHGSGKMLAFVMPLEHIYTYNHNCTKLIENSFRYLLYANNGEWLSLSTDSTNVPVNDSSIINVTLNGKGLSNGVYTTSIFVESNDPLRSHDTIDVTMHINASAELELDTLISFPSTTQYVPIIDSALIKNPGCDTLQITNINSSSSFFTPGTNQLKIAPNDSLWLTVEFLPTTVGSFSETLTLINNVNDTTIRLNAISIQAPEMTIIPDPVIYDTIYNCGDSITSNFTIYNTGGGTLSWRLQNNISLNDDFESSLNTNLWSNNTGTISSNCGTNNGSGALYFGNSGTRYVETQNLDLRNGARVEFYLKYGASSSPCETLDNGEEVGLQYSTNNGATWNQIALYQRFVHSGNFALVNDTIPQAAQTSNTKLRWIQSSNSGSSFDHWAMDDISITSYGFDDYIKSVQPDSGHITTTDSSLVSIRINSLGLNAGNYLKTIYISSNDPLRSLDSVQLNLTILGTPEIILSDSCINFGSLVANGSKTDSIMFVNTGCEELIISGAIIGSAAFNLISYPDTVYPSDTTYVIVNYNPTTVGVDNSYLRLFNNLKDTTICLTGNSLPAPIIDVNPDSAHYTMNACDDSISFPITVRNLGGSDLTYSVDGNRNDTINILALTYGTDYNGEYANTKQVLINQLNQYTLTELNSTNSAIVQAALNGIDVVLIPEIEYGVISSFSNYATPLQNFVSNGGSVIFCGSYGSDAQAIFNTGLLSGSYQSVSTNYYVNSFSTSHPIVDSVPLPFYTTSGTFTCSFTNPNIVSLLTNSVNEDIIAFREVGLGKVVYIGFDYFNSNASTSRILANAFRWTGGGGSLPSWLELTNNQDTISSSDSTTMNVTIYGKDLSIGSHTYDLIIKNNDPTNDSVTFPININVVATPCADFGFNIPNICSGDVIFTDSTSNNPTTWLWDFGDGSTLSTQQNPSHSYASAGVYQVTLVATNSFGSDTITKSITINKMVADFSVDSPLVTNRFIGFTSNSPGAISWNWNFGNGGSGSGQSLSYSYPSPGSYNVRLITTNGFSCKDTITKLLQIITVGLEEKNINGFEIYPNPNDGNFIVKTGGQLNIEEVIIYNNLGQIIYNKQHNEVVNNDKVDLDDKAKGIYLVKVKMSNGKIAQRKIIVH